MGDYDIFDNPFVDKRKAEEPSGIFICDICDHNFSNSNSLSKHILTVHDSTKITNCDECGKDFSNKKVLDKHIKTVHRAKDDKIFTCGHCNKQFNRLDNMKKHVQA